MNFISTSIILLCIFTTSCFAQYNRKDWKHWNGGVREAVFKEEKIDSFWICMYTGDTVYNSKFLDIDHVIPLKEAYLSGAESWSKTKKELYANYLRNPNHLVAVTASSNRSKGSKDPSKWMPKINKDAYIKTWIEIKKEWNLSFDEVEEAFILNFIKRSNKPSEYFNYK